MAKKKNRYVKKAKKVAFLNGFSTPLSTRKNLKNTAMETGKDFLVAVIGGGVLGAAIGKPSLVVGLATTGVGHYIDNRLIQLLGVGMMASNGFQGGGAVSGLEGLDGVKERMKAYKESFSQKFYLDKFLKKKAVAGFGDVQYFNYPNDTMGELAALDNFENQLLESAAQYQQMTGNDFEEVSGIGDLEERLL